MSNFHVNNIEDKDYISQNKQAVFQNLISKLSNSLDLIDINSEYIEMHLNTRNSNYSYEKVSESLQDIQQAKLNAESSFYKLVSIFQIDNGTLLPQSKQFNLSAIFETICEYSNSIYELLGVKVILESADEKDILLNGDRTFAESVLLNLLCFNLKSCIIGGIITFSIKKNDNETLIIIKSSIATECDKYTETDLENNLNSTNIYENPKFEIENYLCAAYCKAMNWSIDTHYQSTHTVTTILIPSEFTCSMKEDNNQINDFELIAIEQISQMNILRELRCVPGLEQLDISY